MADNLFTLLKTQYDCLTKTEKKIAAYLLERPDDFLRAYISKLAERIGVAQGSIHNFAKKFSCDGFSALKLRIAKDLQTYQAPENTNLKQHDSMKGLIRQSIEQSNLNFENTLSLNDEETLIKAVELLLRAKNIQIYGIYHSGIAAQDFCYQLIQLGIPATFISDPLIGAVSATLLDKDCLMIAISASGRTKEILDTVNYAKEREVPILAITSHQFSPLAKIADLTLLTAADDSFLTGRFQKTRQTQLFIIDALCDYLHRHILNKETGHNHRLKEILASHNVCD